MTPIVDGDYERATIQMVCLLHEKLYYPIFASVELLPSELPPLAEEPVQSARMTRIAGKPRVFYSRYQMSAKDALAWYDQCRQGNFALLQGDADSIVAQESLSEEPSWPQLVIGSKFPFSGDVPSSVRAHHLYPARIPPLLEKLFEQHAELRAWVSEKLFVNLDRYPELVGSVHLIAPNPVFRNFSTRLHVDTNAAESTAIEVTPREGMASKGLGVTIIEHRPTGISSYQHRTFDEHPYLLVPHVGSIEQIEVYVHCPLRGLLEWQEPSSYLRQATFQINAVSSRKHIKVPGPLGATVDEYQVQVPEALSHNTYKTVDAPSSLPAMLRGQEFARRRSDEAERLGQKWFHGSRAEATEFVRSLVGSARSRVWIIDPYFAAPELFSFALATSYTSARVMILTGASTAMQSADSIDSTIEAGEQLLKTLSQQGMPDIEVLVMTGDTPTVHDRFLVIDDAVWFTGNSLNSIGERAGMMISIPAPELVISKITAITRDSIRTKPLKNWVADRKRNKGK